MKYHALSIIFKKQQNLKFLSAVNYMWHFIGLVSSGVVRFKTMVLLLLLVCCLLLLLLCVSGCVLLYCPASQRHYVVSLNKSESDVIYFYKVIRDSESIDHLCINPIHRIGLIHK